ncbi:MAG: histidine phosphatase family protein [Armatimonadetes bacterium]|nr:histidine phosphatase family protein [Armatimonadota bacterium]
MLELWLIRHGQTDWNRQQRWQGQTETPLNQNGMLQARQLGARLRAHTFDGAYSSDMGRCLETARLSLPGHPLSTDGRLRELNFGVYEGRAWTELTDAERKKMGRWWFDPYSEAIEGGESFVDLSARVEAWLDSLPPQGSFAVFTHGGVIRSLIWRVTGPPRDPAWTLTLENCSITRLGFGREHINMHCVNDCAHLQPFEFYEPDLEETPAFDERPAQ